ncbi:MAG: hypothetical protein IIA45_11210 [Bacteroidetes bacterium]|nr:hypothetical protein [Bacteroidota bacterium]
MADNLSEEDMDYIFDSVRNELSRMNEQKQRTIKRSEASFAHWLKNAVNKMGKALGYIISLPFRAIAAVWKWLFG